MSFQTHRSPRNAGFDSVRILLVEDEARVRNVMKEVLEMQGFLVVECETAEQALLQSTASLSRFDVLLTDAMLPGKTGRQLARDLRQRIPALKTILVSGYGEAQALLGAEKNDKVSYLPKPFSASSLVAAVQRVTENAGTLSAKRANPSTSPQDEL